MIKGLYKNYNNILSENVMLRRFYEKKFLLGITKEKS